MSHGASLSKRAIGVHIDFSKHDTDIRRFFLFPTSLHRSSTTAVRTLFFEIFLTSIACPYLGCDNVKVLKAEAVGLTETYQKKCYNMEKEMAACPTDDTEDFFGQDACYDGGLMDENERFQKNNENASDPIIFDRQTYVEWEYKSITLDTDTDTDYDWKEAVRYCNDLRNVGNCKGIWNLPSVHLLDTIVHLGEESSTALVNVFGYIKNDNPYLWTSTISNSNKSLLLNCNDGNFLIKLNSFRAKVLCAKQCWTEHAESQELEWQGDCKYNNYKNWKNALQECSHDDWRLPNRRELLSILAFENAGSEQPLADSKHLPCIRLDHPDFWTSTTNTDKPTDAWKISFYDGAISSSPKDDELAFLCVRNSKN